MSITPFISSTQNDNTMVLVARRYQAAGTEVLVRLIPQELVPAEDLALATLGLDPTTLEPNPIGFIPSRAVGFPAWPILTDPDNAQHALNLVSDIEWIRKNARAQVKLVKKRVDKLTNQLQASAPHFVPTFLEEIARVHLEADHASYAKQYFNKAREVERNHSLPVDIQRHQLAFREFTALGVVSGREMTAEAHNAAIHLEPKAAYQYFLELLLTCAHADVALYNHALRDLRRLGKTAGRTHYEVDVEFASQYVLSRGFATFPEATLQVLRPMLQTKREAPATMKKQFLSGNPSAWKVAEYVDVLQKLDIWEALTTNSEAFTPWLIKLFHQKSHSGFFAIPKEEMLAAITGNTRSLTDRTVKIKVKGNISFNLEYLDALVAAGATVEFDTDSRFDMESLWNSWFTHGNRDLTALVDDAKSSELLLQHLTAETVHNHLDKLLSTRSTTELTSRWLDIFANEIKNNVNSHSWQFERLKEQRFLLTDPRLKELNPQAINMIFHAEVAVNLAKRLNEGTFAEYTWTTFEEACEKLTDSENAKILSCYPYVILAEENQVILVNGQHLETVQLPAPANVIRVYKVVDHVVVFYRDKQTDNYYYFWSHENVPHLLANGRELPESMGFVQQIDGGLQVGPTRITPGMAFNEIPSGFTFGSGPYYVGTDNPTELLQIPGNKTISLQEFHDGAVAGNLPGLDTSSLQPIWGMEDTANLKINYSWYLPATESTKNSLLGVTNGYLMGFSFEGIANNWYHWFSPVEAFSARSAVPLWVVERPGWEDDPQLRDTWYHNGQGLIDDLLAGPLPESLDCHGKPLVLNSLPVIGFHQLKVRNKDVSIAMRKCSENEALELVIAPQLILDFAQGNEVLAAAIAGMLAQVYQSQLETDNPPMVPKLTAVPQYLKYLAEVISDATAEQNVEIFPNVSIRAFHYLGELTGAQCFGNQLAYEHCREIATKISTSQSGFYDTSTDYLKLLGQEKLILARLSGPGIPIDEFHELIELFRWLAHIGILGSMVRVETDKSSLDRLLADDPDLLVYNGRNINTVFVLWRPEITTPTREWLLANNNHAPWAFLPRDKFLEKLEELLNWRDSLTDVQRASRIATLGESAKKLANVTMLPPSVWHLILSGVLYNYDPLGYRAQDAKLLGKTPTAVDDLSKFLITSNLGYRELVTAGWHDDYLSGEPNIESVAEQWQKQRGTPWIHLDDSIIKPVAKYMDNAWLPPEPFMAKAELPTQREEAAFLFYVMLMQITQPRSAAACELASRLEQFRAWTPPSKPRVFGSSYQQEADQYAPQLVSQGYLDQWLEFLVSGTAYNGTPEDPRVSAMLVVAEVQAELGLSTNAACYFLQILSLATPTDTLVKRWNGWNKKQLDTAASELLERGLLVTGKRASSGRSVFLAGGWLGKSTTGPAIEMWKAPHYLLWEASVSRPVLPGCPALVPHGELFAQTWQRYQSGDVPGYEELRTAPYRRR
ncbi:hypothetical protein [Corynebacterium freiburgense]|uniref:hypothetical protein n=1 Tax=Corynebacterium freiburgense TaxID=556548 RepID=UPI00047CE677|nr:hypothetical protein [Corynebacterium freiburgense]WJZ02738.1 hypothetical protein CFREI_07265 [Corynebacterium freiburgense]